MRDPDPPAHIVYDTPDYTVIRPGSHVRCAVTGERIELANLKYWSVRRQEAYRGAAEAAGALSKK